MYNITKVYNCKASFKKIFFSEKTIAPSLVSRLALYYYGKSSEAISSSLRHCERQPCREAILAENTKHH